jgi:type IV secretion system protein VirB3
MGARIGGRLMDYSNASQGVIADSLFLGVTRPALALGVPYAALLMNAMLTMELFLTTHNLLCLLICLPLHGFAWLACLAEPRFFDLLAVWAQVRMRGGRNGTRAWRARSYGCFCTRIAREHLPPAAVVEDAEKHPCIAQ